MNSRTLELSRYLPVGSHAKPPMVFLSENQFCELIVSDANCAAYGDVVIPEKVV
jgi:hypothetical protein